MVGLLSGRDLRRRNSTIVVGSDRSSSVAWGLALACGEVVCTSLTFEDSFIFFHKLKIVVEEDLSFALAVFILSRTVTVLVVVAVRLLFDSSVS